jgi:dipeptidyl aminopeptidase/acylaminoacyl peptidase
MKRVIITILLVLASLSVAPAQDVWTPEKMLLVKKPDNAAISPDGKWIAFNVAELPKTEDKSEYLVHIWISSPDGSHSYQLTAGDKSCYMPRWSPDGKWLAFISARSGKPNLWLIHPDGGEGRQLTDVDTGVHNFSWSRDGGWIAFIGSDPVSPEESAHKDDPRVVDKDIKYSRIYRVKVDLDTAEKPKPVRVTQGAFNVESLDWSPDGKFIVFSHQPTPSINDWRNADISIVPSEGGEPRLLAGGEGADNSPLFSPDGKTIAFLSACGDFAWAWHGRICLMPASGGEVTELPETADGSPWPVEWAPDGSGIYYMEVEHTHFHLFFMPVGGGEPHLVSPLPGVWSAPDISADGRLIAFSREDLAQPAEIYTLRLSAPGKTDGAEPMKITSFNDSLPDLPLAKSEVISWTSFDGAQIEGILCYPLNYEEGKRYPLLLSIHGGPSDVYIRNFTAAPDFYPLQAFQAKGFFVLRPNPRGSSGYGWRFRYANFSDWGGGDYKDLMAGVDYLISKGMVDPERLGSMGWSYGGYMTAWITTQTNRFKAAAVGAGVINLVSFTGTTDILGFIPSYFEGEFWERNDIIQARSPLYNIKNATTPTLILHGEADFRVPVSQGYELYHALKRKGVEVEMVVYPGVLHWPQEPKPVLDIMKRHLEFFSKKLLEKD